MENNWVRNANDFYLREVSQQVKELPLGCYKLNINPQTKELFLGQFQNEFAFPYKVYSIEKAFVARVVKTYANTKGNLGILMNGIKGTGKTVTAQMICNALGLPVIIIHQPFEDIPSFLNDLQQDVVVFFDEYEKMYRDYDKDILTVMDGVLNTKHRKVFLLTTNKLHLNDNLIQRPSRLRYIKTFVDLSLDVIMEIIDDKLVHKQFRDECVEFISRLEIITVDIVKAVIDEVNIHEEAPENFKDIFNIKKLENVVNIYVQGPESLLDQLEYRETTISPFKFNQESVGQGLRVGGRYVGEIVQVLDEHTIIIKYSDDDEANSLKDVDKKDTGVKTYRIEYIDKKHKSFNSFYCI